MGDSQELFIAFQALSWRPTHDGCNGSPLSGHQLGQMQQLLIFLSCPLSLFDGWVEPLVPARLALLGGLPHQQ